MPTKEDRLLAAIGHVGYIMAMPVILPLIIYFLKRDNEYVANAAKQALILHVASLIVGVLAFVVCFMTLGLGTFLVVPIMSVLSVGAIICSLIACVKIADGKVYKYPIIGELF